MRKSIFLLLILLIACSPTSTSTPTSTPIPPTATAIPPPTETPAPTPTPEGFQTSPDGNVQIFENGKWEYLKAPEGLWGSVDGTSVVLVDDGRNQEAFTQMKLGSGFVDGANGDDLVNVAKYNKETKKWDSLSFVITRSQESLQQLRDIFSSHFDVMKVEAGMPIDRILMNAKIVGLKSEVVEGDDHQLSFLFIYRDKIIKVKPSMITLEKLYPEEFHRDSLNNGQMSLSDILQLISVVNKTEATTTSKGTPALVWDVVPNGATDVDCDKGSVSGITPPELAKWCKSEVAKGNSRQTPSTIVIETKILQGNNLVRLPEDIDELNLEDLWNQTTEAVSVDGTFLQVWITLNP